MKTFQGTLALLLLIAFSASAEADWTLRKIEGRDYIPVREIAEFYGFTNGLKRSNKTVVTEQGKRNLAFTENTREAAINGVKHWLNFPALVAGGELHVSRVDLAKTIEPALRPHLIKEFDPVTTVVIDAGHGGSNKGAYSPIAYEKEFTLDVARRLQILLQKAGFRVVMTRSSDQSLGLEARAAMANKLSNCIFVSIHFNSATWNRNATGFEIYSMTPPGAPSTNEEGATSHARAKHKGDAASDQSFALSNAIYHSMLGKIEMPDRGVKRARFAVLRHAEVPSVLIEGGFLTNKEDLTKLASKEWRARYAQSIALGILEYKKLAEHRAQPRLLADYRGPVAPKVPQVTLRDLPASGN